MKLLSVILLVASLASAAEIKPGSIQHVIVYSEPGRFAGWPANNGVWVWGNEILVGFEQNYFKADDKSHSYDKEQPQRGVLARSLDGGETWKLEIPEAWPGRKLAVLPSPGKFDFAAPGFAMRVSGKEFFVSSDKGKQWKGPCTLSDFGFNLTSRTDYLVNGKNDLLIFLSGDQPDVKAGNYKDRTFCARTTDGGQTFQFQDWMTAAPLNVGSVMPTTVRTSATRLVSAMRRKVTVEEGGKKKDSHWIDVYESPDNGKTWRFLSKVADTDRGEKNGNPPAMIRLRDGRLCVAYGFRSLPYGMRAKISTDEGKTWASEIVLRKDAGTWDFGYPRMIQRPDGKIVTIYYYNTNN